jgi:hypothetical protein
MIDVQIKALDKIAQQVVAKVVYMNQNQYRRPAERQRTHGNSGDGGVEIRLVEVAVRSNIESEKRAT